MAAALTKAKGDARESDAVVTWNQLLSDCLEIRIVQASTPSQKLVRLSPSQTAATHPRFIRHQLPCVALAFVQLIQHMKSNKYCIYVKGFKVNNPRVESILYKCIPVIISYNYMPPFFEVLSWKEFAVVVAEKDIPSLKNILVSIPREIYLMTHMRVKNLQQHFYVAYQLMKYDIFDMILHSIWYNRFFQISLK
ncbi:hypothetical protein Syun_012345 [Stephania yunnanensis]|uniref:Exostosin GT47 domain-containing protein n=1 Tax=Stephania yunnanensis TaxID=152371 RepID=A0AAP0PIX2_9MAGN